MSGRKLKIFGYGQSLLEETTFQLKRSLLQSGEHGVHVLDDSVACYCLYYLL